MQFMSNPNGTSDQIRDKPIAALPNNHPAKRVVDKARRSVQRQNNARNTLANREHFNQLQEQPQGYNIHSYTRDLSDVALAGSVTAGLVLPPALALALIYRHKTRNSKL